MVNLEHVVVPLDPAGAVECADPLDLGVGVHLEAALSVVTLGHL